MSSSLRWAPLLVATGLYSVAGSLSCKEKSPPVQSKHEISSTSTPGDIIRACTAAITKDDIGLFLKCHALPLRNEIMNQDAEFRQVWPAYCQVMSRGEVMITSEHVQGDRANATVVFQEEGITREYGLVRESGQWTIVSPPPLVCISILTRQLNNADPGTTALGATTNPCSQASLDTEMARTSCPFSTKHPDLWKAIGRLRWRCDRVPAPRFYQPEKGARPSEVTKEGEANSVSVKLPAGQAIAGAVSGSIMSLSTGYGPASVSVELVTDNRDCRLPPGFTAVLDGVESGLGLGNTIEVRYSVFVDASVGPGSYDLAFRLRGSSITHHLIAFAAPVDCLGVIRIRVHVQEAEFAVNVADAVAAYWHVLLSTANVERRGQDYLDMVNRHGFGVAHSSKADRLLDQAASSQRLVAHWYFGSLRSSRDRDIRMVAELLALSAQSAATTSSRAHNE